MKMKKMLAVVSTLCMMCAVMPVTENAVSDVAVLSANAEENVTYDMLTYTKYEDYAEVSGCNDLAMKIEVPAEVDGLPVTGIANRAFQGCSSLAQITLPDSITKIGDYAFSGCSKLESFTIPSGVSKIGYLTFGNCSSLTSFTVPSNIKTIDGDAFNNCTAMTFITIENGVESIGSNAFYSCSALEKIDLPESVTKIDSKAFARCKALTSFTIPDTVTTLGEGIFYLCDNLASVHLPAGLEKIPNGMFEYCAIEEVNFPESLTQIGSSAFVNCDFTSVVIPKKVSNIDSLAFDGCENITNFTILNPSCTIASYALVLNKEAIIHGYALSSAQAYAEKNNYQFEVIAEGTEPATEEPTQTETEPETNNDIAYMKENQITLDFNDDGVLNAQDASLLLVYAAEKGAGNTKSLEEFFQKHNLN